MTLEDAIKYFETLLTAHNASEVRIVKKDDDVFVDVYIKPVTKVDEITFTTVIKKDEEQKGN